MVMAPPLHYDGIIETQFVTGVLDPGVTALLYRLSLRRELSSNQEL